jgi:hypothetical protein
MLEHGKYLDKKKVVVVKEWPGVFEWSGYDQPRADKEIKMCIAIRANQDSPIDYTSYFGDQRLEVRGNQIAAEMLHKETVILNQLAASRAEQVGSSRFFKNDQVSQDALREEATTRCAEIARGLHVLAIQDTSEINYQQHAGRLDLTDPDLGPLGNNQDIGFFLHPMLVVDAQDGFPLGFSDIYLWNRAWDHPTKEEREYKKLPIEEKESFRWITVGQATKDLLSEAASVTIVADREADIYEEFVDLPDTNTHLLIRSTQNRRLAEQEDKLFEYVGGQGVAGTYTLEIPIGHSNREARIAEIEVRFCPVKLARPMNASNKTLPEYVAVYAIEATEVASSVPAGEKPILWRLVTTHSVTTFAEALRIIQWYRWRWIIEQLFRTLNHQGLDVEASQLETGAGLKKLVIMALSPALRILQLTLERDGTSGRPGSVVFSVAELEFLHVLLNVYEGPGVQQHNPFPVDSLAWAAWIIGRIGGWKGYKKADPAGPLTIKRG